MHKPVSIIVNADDLGMSRCVNDATFGLMASGKITSATILANAPSVKEACEQLRLFPQCSFGVHLNLTQFEPLSRPGLELTEAGQLSRKIVNAQPTRRLVRAVYEEFCAQVDRLVSFGVPITHFDSHHHVHTVPFVFVALKALQRRYGIRRVRLSKNLYAPGDTPAAALVWRKRVYNSALRSLYSTITTAGFTELISYAQLVRQAVPAFPSVELMVHPGSEKYAEETALLEAGWAEDWTAFRLIPYGGLC